MKIRRGPAPGEMLVKESAAHLGPELRGEGESINPWSALLMGRMLTQRKTCGNQEKPPGRFTAVAGAESKSDSGNIFLDQLLGIKADHFAARIQQRAAGIAGIDRRVGLNPGAWARRSKFTHGTDNAFGHAEPTAGSILIK
jgi:hypothetical protein